MSHEMKPFANTLELIKGQPEYRCILKDQESSFWYSPLAKEKFALLMHDESEIPKWFRPQNWNVFNRLVSF
ncbi:MAG: hypothetical protein ACLUFA_07350 [[Clostridium] leptum]